MKLGLLAAASIAALTLGSGTASAQYLVPHNNHYHVVPSYSPPVYGGYGNGYGYQSYSQPDYGGGFGYQSYSPRVGVGGYYSQGFGGGYRQPSFGYGGGYGGFGGYGNSGHHHHHHHHR